MRHRSVVSDLVIPFDFMILTDHSPHLVHRVPNIQNIFETPCIAASNVLSLSGHQIKSRRLTATVADT